MNTYELTLVLPGKATAAKKKSVVAKIENLIKTLKGKITKSDDWGEVKLAYQIAGNETGKFLHFELELEAEFAKAIPKKFKLEQDIIRYLLLKKEK